MKTATLIFLIDRDNRKVCLGMKKRGFGVNRWNGYGGKVQDGEDIEDAAIREIKEETTNENGNGGITVRKENLDKVAVLNFIFPESKSEWNQQVHAYFVYEWEGEELESEEMRPQWYDFDKIPYSDMWSDDEYWLSRALNGEYLEADFTFDENDKMIYNEVKVI